LIINENNVNTSYYCKVFNPNAPMFQFDYNGSVVSGACMEYLNTDPIVFVLATDEEILAETYEKEYITALSALSDNSVSDGTVTLVPPLKGEKRRNILGSIIRWHHLGKNLGHHGARRPESQREKSEQ
jgi:hypothetical protein